MFTAQTESYWGMERGIEKALNIHVRNKWYWLIWAQWSSHLSLLPINTLLTATDHAYYPKFLSVQLFGESKSDKDTEQQLRKPRFTFQLRPPSSLLLLAHYLIYLIYGSTMNLELFMGTMMKSCSSPWVINRRAQVTERTELNCISSNSSCYGCKYILSSWDM